jgi:hypothetical protein
LEFTPHGRSVVAPLPFTRKINPTAEIALSRKVERRLLTVLLLVFIGVGAWNIRVLTQAQVSSLSQTVVDLEASIYLAAKTIDAEIEDHGTLPSSLDELGIDDEGLTYRANGSGYELEVRNGEHAVSYRSGQDLSRFEAAFRALMDQGARP